MPMPRRGEFIVSNETHKEYNIMYIKLILRHLGIFIDVHVLSIMLTLS